MEPFAIFFIGVAALAFLAAGAYLHFLRMKAQAAMPAPLVYPHGKRRPARRKR